MKKATLLLVVMLIGVSVYVITHTRCDGFIHTPSDTIEDYEDDMSFVYEPRADLCFGRDTYNGRMSLAPCEDVKVHINARLTWLTNGIWYFQDVRKGICMAGGSHRNIEMMVPVPCSHVIGLLGAPEGRYRFDQRVTRR